MVKFFRAFHTPLFHHNQQVLGPVKIDSIRYHYPKPVNCSSQLWVLGATAQKPRYIFSNVWKIRDFEN